MKKVVIIGAGLTGLSVAYHLNKEKTNGSLSYSIIEKCSRAGGLCKTEEEKGFLFDYTGHLLHFRTPYFKKFINNLLGRNLEKCVRNAWIYSNDVYTKYPFQANLYGLPNDIIVECIYEYCKAYFNDNKKSINSFNDWITINFGRGIARHFMIPYNLKLWRLHPKKMTCDWLERFVPKPDLKQVLHGSISDRSSTMGYNSTFYYPKEGGIESLIECLTDKLGYIHLKQEVKKIDLNKKRIYTVQGKIYPFDIVVSTLPITEFVRMINNKPQQVQQAAKDLKYVSVLNINFGVKRDITKKHWVYIPEKKLPFYRIGFSNNFSKKIAPQGHSAIYTEISYIPEEGIDYERTRDRVIKNLIKMGVINDNSEIVAERIMDIPCAYVHYDSNRKRSLIEIMNFLESKKIFSVGRYGAWEYSSMEDSVLDGKKIADKITQICIEEKKQGKNIARLLN